MIVGDSWSRELWFWFEMVAGDVVCNLSAVEARRYACGESTLT